MNTRTRRGTLVALLSGLIAGCTVASTTVEPPDASASSVSSPTTMTPTATVRETPPISPPPSAAPEPLPADLDPDLADAIRLRRSYGLRFDLAYVREVASDPRATDDYYGVPVYPEEFEDAQRRFAESMAVAQTVIAYAAGHADESGGVYIDEATHAGLVSLWTNRLPEHAAAITAAVGPGARVAFGAVRYPEIKLRELQDHITDDVRADWVADIPAQMQSIGVDIQSSQVVVKVSSANPDAVKIIEQHYNLGDRFRVESDGTGAALVPWGTVKGRVEPVAWIGDKDLLLDWTGDDPGTCGGGDMGFGVDRRGWFELPCQAGSRTVIVKAFDEGDGHRELGRGTVVVKAGQTMTMTIDLTKRP